MPSPLGHCLIACSLYADRPPVARRSWTTLGAFVFFANAPDLDFIPGLLIGQPLLFHRGMTHSLVFAVSLAAVAAVAMSWRGRSAALGAARLVFFALLSHIVLDFFCAPAKAEGVALFWPLTAERFAAVPAFFPLFSHGHLLSWGSVVAAVGEVAILSAVLLLAVIRKTLVGTPEAPSAPQTEAPSPFAPTEATE